MEGCVGSQSTISLSIITCRRGLYGTVVKSMVSGARHLGLNPAPSLNRAVKMSQWEWVVVDKGL